MHRWNPLAEIVRSEWLNITVSGALAGLLSGTVVIAFRVTIDGAQRSFLPGGEVGNYELLDPLVRLVLCVAGAGVLALLFQWVRPETRSVGIVHVLDRFWSPRETGRLPLRNAIVQFIGGTLAIVSGQSVDREGPGVHLGAAAGSLLGQSLGLAAEDLRTVIACGVAASIAAAFNTPLAGVIFVIEVIRVRYTVPRFIPVLLAAVMGAVIGRAVFGPTLAFHAPPVRLVSLMELPVLGVLGLILGLLAAAFIGLCEGIARYTRNWPILPAFLLAGLVTGICGLWTPQIMGVSYDTLHGMLHERVGVGTLIGILCFKLIATAVSVGLRIPGGLIGPTLVTGSATGAIIGFLAQALFAFDTGSSGFYAVIGMAVMMGAALRAPLAALIALLELTGNPNIILPGLLALVSADGVARSLLGKESIFFALLKVQPPRQGG
jgi:CIC family chloride channel protein